MTISGTTQVEKFGDTFRKEWLRGSGHVQRRNRGKTRHRIFNMELSGRRKTARPQRRFMQPVGDMGHRRMLGQGEMKTSDPLWEPLKGSAERRSGRR